MLRNRLLPGRAYLQPVVVAVAAAVVVDRDLKVACHYQFC